MRSLLTVVAILTATTTGLCQDAAPAATPAGNYFLWYTSGPPTVQQRLAIVQIENGKISALSAPQNKPTFDAYKADAGKVTTTVKLRNTELTFEAQADPADPKQYLGTLSVDDRVFRAGMSPTDKTELSENDALYRADPAPEVEVLMKDVETLRALRQKAARAENDEERKKLETEAEAIENSLEQKAAEAYTVILNKYPGTPAAVEAAEMIVNQANNKAVTPESVTAAVAALEADAKKHGPKFEAVATSRLAATLVRQGAPAPLALKYAKLASELPGLSAKNRAASLRILAAAQEKAGEDPAATNEALAKLEGEIDSEYKKTVPPFTSEKYAGRKDDKANRAVVMELFTGAECPPCVAADVGFDGLTKRYDGLADVVLLQYHLHIPRPDPLTNPVSVARFEYYRKISEDDFGGTPSCAFNGKPAAGGGGGMSGSKGKYDEFAGLIDKTLEETTPVRIQGSATRNTDMLNVEVTVDLGDKEATDSIKLRLVLAEDEIKYVGGNGLRFHHHVVRGMFGTENGLSVKDLKDGKHTATANVGEVRAGLVKYLDEYKGRGGFPNADRPLALENLKVYALVQDDASGEILQAVELK